MKVVIVGGVAGGASAAARIRRLDEHAQIIMIERSGYVSYANCGLPYYVGGVIVDRDELTLQTPESFWDRFRIDVRVRQEVTAINPAEKTVTVRTLDSGKIYTETYDKLLLAPGAKPTVPALSGVDSERVFTLRTVEDTLRIRRFIEEEKPKTAVLAGGGFIGLEMAENLAEMGIAVTIVQRPKQLLAPLDADMASFIHAEMRAHGVTLRLGETVEGFRQEGSEMVTLLAGNEPLRSDMVLLAIGVTPDTHLAKEAGLDLGIRGSIVVNERMETSVPDIYAVGDAVEVSHFVTGQKALISLAGPANKQGRIAADNVCGGNSRFTGSQGSSVLKVFDLTAASTGINEKNAKAAGIAYEKVVLFPASHAAYYPGAQSLTMKVLYEKETLRLLGAQIVGREGADKRIDVLATAIRAGMTALELTELDLAYAPPYSSAKDPVNMAGFMIEDLESGKVRQFHWDEVADLPRDGSAALLDVRTEWEYQRGHLDGFRNIPVDDLREHLDELERDKPVYMNCQTGLRSYLACRLLTQYGFTCAHLAGGYGFYRSVTREQQTAQSAYPCGMEKL
ncbi:FAD-dependent oxidoreductase [Oscillibacter valericigenes]|nr:FAD-dependent oxidoreductase [Oscillibacter valericigenes]